MRATLGVRPLQTNMDAHVQGATALALPSV
jgi:hypothetical protein